MQRTIERTLFDHLVSVGEQRKLNSETERLRTISTCSADRSLSFSPL
jgi:hypothetical protein